VLAEAARDLDRWHAQGLRFLGVLDEEYPAWVREVHASCPKWTSTPRTVRVLLHSRFRPAERAAHLERALGEPADTIVVATQVLEAASTSRARR
jgi:hypothetical protein